MYRGYTIGNLLLWKVDHILAHKTIGAEKIKTHARFINMAITKINQVIEATLNIVFDKEILVKVTLIGIVSIFIHYLLLYFAAISLGIRLGFVELLIFLAFIKLSLIINVTPGNVGVREILYGALGCSFGLKVSEGILLSALLRINSYIVIVSLGLIFGGSTLIRETKRNTTNVKT